MIAFNEREYERFLRKFGEGVAASHASLPPLPGDGFRWRLVLECKHDGGESTVQHIWVAEPLEAKP